MPRLHPELEVLEFGDFRQRHLLKTAVELVESMNRLETLRDRGSDQGVLIRAAEHKINESEVELPKAFAAVYPNTPHDKRRENAHELLRHVEQLTGPQRQRILANAPEPVSRGFSHMRLTPWSAMASLAYSVAAVRLAVGRVDLEDYVNSVAQQQLIESSPTEQAIFQGTSIAGLTGLGLLAAVRHLNTSARNASSRQLKFYSPMLEVVPRAEQTSTPITTQARGARLVDVVVCAHVDPQTGTLSPTGEPQYFRGRVATGESSFAINDVNWEKCEAPTVPHAGLAGRSGPLIHDQDNLLYPALIRYVSEQGQRVDVYPDPDGKQAVVALDRGGVARVQTPDLSAGAGAGREVGLAF